MLELLWQQAPDLLALRHMNLDEKFQILGARPIDSTVIFKLS